MNDPSPTPFVDRTRRRRGRLFLGGGILLAATVIAVAGLLLLRGKPPSWRLLAADGVASLEVDGVAVSTADLLHSSIRSGSHLQIGASGEVRVGIPGMAEITLTPNTEITLGSSKGGLDGSLPAVTLHRGHVRGEATPQFHGLWVETYTASTLLQGAPSEVEVHHDTLNVVAGGGDADVLAKTSGEMTHVPAGNRLLLAGPEGPPTIEPLSLGSAPPETSSTAPGAH